MAWLAATFGCTVSYMDGGSNVTTREYMMDPDVATFDDAAVAALAIIAKIVNLTDAALPSYRVFQVFNEGSLVIPAATVQIENCASLTVQLAAAGNKKGNINVPAPKIGAFVGSTGPQSNIVNMGAAIVTEFLANFLVAGSFTVSDGEEITRGLNGKRVHKRSNKG